MSNYRPILVVGIGNILLRDEGIGVYVIKEIQKHTLPNSVELLDGGTAGADLLDHICNRQKVIIIDAVDADISPGTILRLKADDIITSGLTGISLHELGLAETLIMAKQLKCAPQQATIIGIKPKEVNCGIGLSPEIQHLIPRIIDAVFAEITLNSPT